MSRLSFSARSLALGILSVAVIGCAGNYKQLEQEKVIRFALNEGYALNEAEAWEVMIDKFSGKVIVPSDRALVYVYRTAAVITGRWIPTQVYADEMDIGEVLNMSYRTFYTYPGPLTIKAVTSAGGFHPRNTVISTEGGKAYYLSMDWSFVTGFAVKVENEATGAADIKGKKFMGMCSYIVEPTAYRKNKEWAARKKLIAAAEEAERARKSTEREELNKAAASADRLGAYIDFLRSHPKSELKPEAVAEAAKLIAGGTNPVKIFRQFMNEFPEAKKHMPEGYALYYVGPDGMMVFQILDYLGQGFGEDILAAKITVSNAQYRNFTFEEAARLKQMGLSDRLIGAMIQSNANALEIAEGKRREEALQDRLRQIERENEAAEAAERRRRDEEAEEERAQMQAEADLRESRERSQERADAVNSLINGIQSAGQQVMTEQQRSYDDAMRRTQANKQKTSYDPTSQYAGRQHEKATGKSSLRSREEMLREEERLKRELKELEKKSSEKPKYSGFTPTPAPNVYNPGVAYVYDNKVISTPPSGGQYSGSSASSSGGSSSGSSSPAFEKPSEKTASCKAFILEIRHDYSNEVIGAISVGRELFGKHGDYKCVEGRDGLNPVEYGFRCKNGEWMMEKHYWGGGDWDKNCEAGGDVRWTK